MSKNVFVGMSGGVDSSLTAALLKEQGFTVTGIYMKNWSKDLPGFHCPWKEDYQDAKRVAVQLGIDFMMFDFESDYRKLVVEYMLDSYQQGLTPNPDIMCNQEIKFKLFLMAAQGAGADMIATGHYARVQDGHLLIGRDSNKDQSYFMYRVSSDALKRVILPIGDLTKPVVRAMAKKRRLITAAKKDSQGICFVGNIGIKEFLLAELGTMPHGAIIDQHGNIIGEHDGALFYTIGQRHGLHVGGGLPYYVTGKNMKQNEVYVTTNLQDMSLWKTHLTLSSLHWINEKPAHISDLHVRTRYRAPLVSIKHTDEKSRDTITLELTDEVRALTPGQSAVLYDGERVVGGGIVV